MAPSPSSDASQRTTPPRGGMILHACMHRSRQTSGNGRAMLLLKQSQSVGGAHYHLLLLSLFLPGTCFLCRQRGLMWAADCVTADCRLQHVQWCIKNANITILRACLICVMNGLAGVCTVLLVCLPVGPCLLAYCPGWSCKRFRHASGKTAFESSRCYEVRLIVVRRPSKEILLDACPMKIAKEGRQFCVRSG